MRDHRTHLSQGHRVEAATAYIGKNSKVAHCLLSELYVLHNSVIVFFLCFPGSSLESMKVTCLRASPRHGRAGGSVYVID